MVQASTLILAAFAVAPVLSAPLSVHNHHTHPQADVAEPRSIDTVDDSLELREPFKFGKIFRKAAGFVKKVAVPAASLLLRDVDGNLVERELDLSELAELDARSPSPFNFKKLLRGGLKVATTAAKILIRDEEGNVYIRDLDMGDISERDETGTASDVDARDLFFLDLSELSEREIADLDLDLESREPFRFKNLIKKVGGIAGKATRIAGTVANVASGLGFRELEDEVLDVDARDVYYAIDDVFERDFADAFEELDAREPKFRFGNALKKVGGFARKAVGVAGHVANVAGSLGLRELEDEIEMEARSLEDLD
jgi:hypothetical protein